MNQIIDKLRKNGIEQVLFVGATILSAGAHFLFSIYVKAYVQPLEYGMYSTCVLLQTYLAYLQLGTLNAFNRDYPQLVGAKNCQKACEYRNIVFSFLIVVYIMALIAIIAISLFIKDAVKMDNRLVIGFIFMAIITTITIIENYGNYRCRIDRGFVYSSIVVLFELLAILLGILLIPRIGYYAIYITSIVEMGIGIIFFYKPSYSDFKFSFNILFLKEILVSGTPLLINGLIWTVINSIDKFVILGFMNTEMLGIYGIAQNAFSYMVLIPSAMSQLFYVNMGKEYGVAGSKEVLMRISIKYAKILAGVTSFIALVALFLLPLLVEIFMPNYIGGIVSAQILIMGLSIYAATLINGNILTILKRNSALLINSICMCFFNICFSLGFVYLLGAKIESVAWGTAISYIFCSFLIIYQVYRCGECKLFDLVNASVVPVLICLLPGFFIYRIIENKIIGCLLSVVCLSVIYLIGYRKIIMERI